MCVDVSHSMFSPHISHYYFALLPYAPSLSLRFLLPYPVSSSPLAIHSFIHPFASVPTPPASPSPSTHLLFYYCSSLLMHFTSLCPPFSVLWFFTGMADGFSRKILYMAVVTVNNQPSEIVPYYLQLVREHGNVPVKVLNLTKNNFAASESEIQRERENVRDIVLNA